MKYDLIMPIIHEDWEIAKISIDYIRKYIHPIKIIIIGNKKLKSLVEAENVDFIDEDTLYDGLTLDIIRQLLYERIMDDSRAGWYFQQFLKMSYSFKCSLDYYLLWDADTIPLNNIELFDEMGTPYFHMKSEYNKSYFDTIFNLLCLPKKIKESFISEHMIIDKNIMKTMLKEIENNNKLSGCNFYEKIINSISLNDLNKSGFSEFETYGTYVTTNFPQKYNIKKFNNVLRHGKRYFLFPDNDSLCWASKSYKTISFEKSDDLFPLYKLFHSSIIRIIIPLKYMVTFFRIFYYFPKGIWREIRNAKI